jgi:predicted dehydrogenase
MRRDKRKRFALIGAGFWSQYHLSAWAELPEVECVAICDADLSKAQRLSQRFGGVHVYDRAEELLARQSLDFVDIVTDVDSHVSLASLAIEKKIPTICQKPLAPNYPQARRLCFAADATKVPLLVHENWRWQAPLRRFKQIIDSGELGTLVRARIDYANSFPVYDNQPALKRLKQFIIADMGTHILDVSRFLFGEAVEVYCQSRRMRDDIDGEDVATVMMKKKDGLTVTCNMSYASRWEYDCFPQTMVAVEGTRGGAALHPHYEIRRIDQSGNCHRENVPLPKYPWCDPEIELVHSSMVACQTNLLAGVTGRAAETTAADNLKTLELVYAAYESSSRNALMTLPFTGDGWT